MVLFGERVDRSAVKLAWSAVGAQTAVVERRRAYLELMERADRPLGIAELHHDQDRFGVRVTSFNVLTRLLVGRDRRLRGDCLLTLTAASAVRVIRHVWFRMRVHPECGSFTPAARMLE
jgi:hypothetical protein